MGWLLADSSFISSYSEKWHSIQDLSVVFSKSTSPKPSSAFRAIDPESKLSCGSMAHFTISLRPSQWTAMVKSHSMRHFAQGQWSPRILKWNSKHIDKISCMEARGSTWDAPNFALGTSRLTVGFLAVSFIALLHLERINNGTCDSSSHFPGTGTLAGWLRSYPKPFGDQWNYNQWA